MVHSAAKKQVRGSHRSDVAVYGKRQLPISVKVFQTHALLLSQMLAAIGETFEADSGETKEVSPPSPEDADMVTGVIISTRNALSVCFSPFRFQSVLTSVPSQLSYQCLDEISTQRPDRALAVDGAYLPYWTSLQNLGSEL